MASGKAAIIPWLLSVTGSVYLFTTSSGIHLKNRMDNMLGTDYAHRGLFDMKKGIPENSLAAFDRAFVDRAKSAARILLKEDLYRSFFEEQTRFVRKSLDDPLFQL